MQCYDRIKCYVDGVGDAYNAVTIPFHSEVQGFRNPQQVIDTASNWLPYLLLDNNGQDWEIGVGKLESLAANAPFSRYYPLATSTGTFRLSLSSGGQHTFSVLPISSIPNGVYANLTTSTDQTFTADTASPILWESSVSRGGKLLGDLSLDGVWDAANPEKLDPLFASQFNIKGQLAFYPTTVAAGRWEVEIYRTGIGTKFHTEVPGSTTDRVYVPFNVDLFSTTSTVSGTYQVQVTRRGDATGAALYSADSFCVGQIVR